MFFLIRPAFASIKSIKSDTISKRQQLQKIEDAIGKQPATLAQLQNESATLAEAEKDMATGDPNGWIYDTIRGFKSQYKMDISIASSTHTEDVDMLAKFPYRQLRVTVNGTAFYHDLGKFIANFENNYPHGRICNLLIHPANESGDNAEKLSFSMDIIELIKPNQP
ncbi:MAG: hypothetical protein ACLQSR_04175 [Limisphaerales bacterium]